jgi:hypothetical protein
MRTGAWAWFHDVWTWGAKVLEYWIIFSLKIKLNRSWKFQRNWNVPLVLLGRSWWAGLNGIYLVRYGFRMWEILIFKWFLPMKIQINSEKPGFGRNNKLRTCGNTWTNGTGNTSFIKRQNVKCWKKSHYVTDSKSRESFISPLYSSLVLSFFISSPEMGNFTDNQR